MPANFLKLLTYKPIIIILILGLGISIAVYLAQQRQSLQNFASTKGTILVMIPNWLIVSEGKSYEIEMGINTGEDSITAAEVHLKYDPKRIKIEDIIVGEFLPIIIGKKIDPEIGKAEAIFIINPQYPQKGYGNLGKFKIVVLSEETSDIRFAPESRVTALGKTTSSLETAIGIRLVSQKLHPEYSPKNVLLDQPVPSGVVYVDPTAYVRDFWETPPPTLAPIEKDIITFIDTKKIKEFILRPFEIIGEFNKNLQEKTKEVLKE